MTTNYKVQVPGWPEGTWMDYGQKFLTETEARAAVKHYRDTTIAGEHGDFRILKTEVVETFKLGRKKTRAARG